MLSVIMEPHKKQPRASWCVTNTDTQTITPLRRCRLNLSLRLSARHTTRTRRDPRRGSRPRHAHRIQGARAGRDARGRTRRPSYFGSSSSRRRRRGPWGGPSPGVSQVYNHQPRTRVQGLGNGGKSIHAKRQPRTIFFQRTVPIFGISTRKMPVNTKEILRFFR